MKTLSILERRIAALERPCNMDIDPENAAIDALDVLNETELGLVDEFMNLVWAGFPFEQISEMMGVESYKAALSAVEKADMEYNRITTPTARPKKHGKPLELPKEHRYDECGLGVREDAEA
jgi:hypothetical protein